MSDFSWRNTYSGWFCVLLAKQNVTHLPVLHKTSVRPGGRQGCVSVSSGRKVEVRLPKACCSTPLVRTWTPIRPTCTHAFPMTNWVMVEMIGLCKGRNLEPMGKRGVGHEGGNATKPKSWLSYYKLSSIWTPFTRWKISGFSLSRYCQKSLARKSFPLRGTVWRLFSVNTQQRAWKNPTTTINHSGRTWTASHSHTSLCLLKLQLEQ